MTKKYTNPSSDIIDVLAGLDNVDAVFSDLVTTLETAIRDGRDGASLTTEFGKLLIETVSTKQKATRAAIAVVAGGYQTALVSYFVHRDFFPALLNVCGSDQTFNHTAEHGAQHIQTMDHPLRASEPFLLVGLLANYDKFETHNQYRTRLADFIDEGTMQKIIEAVGWTCKLLRDRYISVLDDTPTAWSIGGTLSYVGLGALTKTKPAAPVLSEDEQRTLFGEQ